MFAITTTSQALPQTRSSHPRNSSRDFVQLSNEILGTNTSGSVLSFQVDLAEVNRFKDNVAASPIPVLVDFFAPGCQPCQTLAPLVNEVVEQHNGKVKLLKINIEENPSVPLHYGIDCFPTLMLFNAGEVVDRITGRIAWAIRPVLHSLMLEK